MKVFSEPSTREGLTIKSCVAYPFFRYLAVRRAEIMPRTGVSDSSSDASNGVVGLVLLHESWWRTMVCPYGGLILTQHVPFPKSRRQPYVFIQSWPTMRSTPFRN